MKYIGKNTNGLDCVIDDRDCFYVATTDYVRNPIRELVWVEAIAEQQNSPDGYMVVQFWKGSAASYDFAPVKGAKRQEIIATAWPMILERKVGTAEHGL